MLPIDFIDRMQSQMGAEFDNFARAIEREPETTVRVNNKISMQKDLETVPWCKDGYYLTSRPQFTLDPLLHAGCYYVQEASSMFVQAVLKEYIKHDSIVLDLCAAPGGKSTLISQWLGENGLLVCNEVVRQRVFILSENIQKWGNGNAVVTHNKVSDFGEKAPNIFDCILVDAPCSGEGMFRKDSQAVEEWSEANVKMCAERQRDILRDVWEALKPGGVLIYSTCTFNEEEDEKNARWIRDELVAEVLPVHIEKEWGIVETTGYHFYPHRVRGEGFYLCAFRKPGFLLPTRVPANKGKKDPNKTIRSMASSEYKNWLKHPEKWIVRQTERFADAYPQKWQDLIEFLNSRFTCILTGFGLSELRGKGMAPQHSLAMLKDFNKDAFSCVELNYEQALKYLRTESLLLENAPMGLLVLMYKGVPLGFAKNVGNRCNNLYPNEWRIRKL